jgi:hypothetical protein
MSVVLNSGRDCLISVTAETVYGLKSIFAAGVWEEYDIQVLLDCLMLSTGTLYIHNLVNEIVDIFNNTQIIADQSAMDISAFHHARYLAFTRLEELNLHEKHRINTLTN